MVDLYVPNFVNTLAQADQAAAFAKDQQRQNALASFMSQNGDALMQGDTNALAQFARLDPMAAMQIQQRQQDQQWRADDRDYNRQQDAIANQRADRQFAATEARQAKQDGRADEEWKWKMDTHMRGLKADDLAAQTAELEGVLSGAAWFYQSGDQAGYDQFLKSKGIDPAQYPFAQFPAHAANFKPVLDAMKGFKPEVPTPQSPQAKFEADKKAGLLPPDAVYQAGGSTTVKVDMGGGAPGLGKLSTDYGYVMDPQSGNPVIDPQTGLPKAAAIPGSPAALEAQKAAQKAEQGGAAKAVSSDTVMTAANEARNLIGRTSTGTLGAGMAYLPESDAAEVNRQIGVMKSVATIETLGAMRAASPTGGALGSVTEKEGAMLAAAAGALDPKAGPERFGKQLDNYERTLLRIIHGPKVGDAIFDQSRDQAKGAGKDGGIPSVSSDADYEALPSGATFRDPNGVMRRKP
ncbi:hypothetical protein GL279_00435 [Paracoccus limosus]|uniref:Uncharacterized protein n=1 Tax=Paracoccus limosus TaxID=913252 RepID=A0A844GZ44_9RHOB|nr:hypothetical protein [Paracoccus limosus]MTH33065.1 hypothetical protein [Paracoccus limosus]